MGLKGLGQIFNVVFKTIGGAVALVMPIISDVAVVLGAIASNLDAVFGTGAGKIILGISAVTLAVWKLNAAAAATAAKFALVFGALNEIIALFTTGYIGTAELALGKDINLSKLPIISDIVGFAQGDGFWSKALSFLGQAVLLLAAIRGILWSIGVKFGVTDMAKSIKKATDKVRGTSSSSSNTKQTSFDFKERRSFKFGEWVDKTVRSGFSGLAGIGRKFLAPQSMAFSSEKEALEYMRQNRLGGEGKNVTVENVTIDVKSDNPEEVATRIREFWDREIMNNYAN